MGSSAAASSARAPVSTPPASASPSPTAPPRPTRQEVVALFGARQPTWFALEGPGITSRTSFGGVCLTLDACGGPGGSGVDTDLLSELESTGTPATLFLNSRWVEANASLAADLGARARSGALEIGNHGTAHCPLCVSGQSAYGIAGTRDAGGVYDEIMEGQQVIAQATGVEPRWFRPGTAHWDDVAVEIAAALGLGAAGFSVNADGGATFSTAQVVQEAGRAGAGDVVIAHMNQPGGSTAEGLVQVLRALRSSGVELLTLSQASGR